MARPKQTISVEVDAEMVVRSGVLIVQGYMEDGRPFWRTFPIEETPAWTQSDLCRRAHEKLEQLLRTKA